MTAPGRSLFAAEAKARLARQVPRAPAARAALVHGLALAGARVDAGTRPPTLRLRTRSASVARLAVLLFRELDPAARTRRPPGGRGVEVAVAAAGPAAMAVARRAGLVGPRGRPRLARILRTRAARRSFLAGLFLGGGSVSDPRAAPHLEMVLPSEEAARLARDVAAGFGVAFAFGRRRGAWRVYLKSAAEIGEFLRLVGAGPSLLALEDERARREVRGRVNRLVNADTANMRKAARAAAAQLQAVRRLLADRGLSSLPAALSDLARLRLEYPEASLAELGALLRPPLGKSGVRHRMARLVALAEGGGRERGAGRPAGGAGRKMASHAR
ncbi:MAG: DNA-binding protein WhiA [Clostridia bacterium]|nr:DNA-binding protein WhiA [Clostridia bacterium]